LVKEYGKVDSYYRPVRGNIDTDFYKKDEVLATFGLKNVAGIEPDKEAISALERWRKERDLKPKVTVYENCTVQWSEWPDGWDEWHKGPGTLTKISYRKENCRVEVKGKTCTINIPNRPKPLVKRLKSQEFLFENDEIFMKNGKIEKRDKKSPSIFPKRP